MGAGQSDLYKGTYGDNPDNIPDELKGKVKLPEHDDQLIHIFSTNDGHIIDTPDNRKMIVDLANDSKYHVGIDGRGLDWNASYNEDGSQNWVCSRNGIIQDCGCNKIPRNWDKETGFKNNARKSTSWRKK